jgi:hypothetical protein
MIIVGQTSQTSEQMTPENAVLWDEMEDQRIVFDSLHN